MKISQIIILAVVTAIVATLLVLPTVVMSTPEDVPRETPLFVVQEAKPALSPAQVIWLARLMQCESGLKAGAINPNDLDNTPSYGILQFKPSTFIGAAIALKLASTTDYMNPELQVAIVTHWVLHGGIDWTQQFPACVEKLGLPPSQEYH